MKYKISVLKRRHAHKRIFSDAIDNVAWISKSFLNEIVMTSFPRFSFWDK